MRQGRFPLGTGTVTLWTHEKRLAKWLSDPSLQFRLCSLA